MIDRDEIAYLRDLNREIGTRHDALLAERDALAEALKLTDEERAFLDRFATSPIEDDAKVASGLMRRLLSVEDNE